MAGDPETASVEELRAEAERWRERALAAERWRDEVWAPLNERTARAREAEDLEARLHEIEASPAWRLTAPLRALSELARRAQRRLRRL
jgi:hypothetical protein